ncbi:MAG: VOC family protein, partial [Anaerolineales bacterium]
MNQHLHLITLGVRDFNKSLEFYTKTLGWKASGSQDDIAFFQASGVVFAIYPREKLAEDALISPEGSGFSGITLAYNARSESEVDEIIKDLKS